jgi:DNA polymerase-3 subunit beta
MKLTLKREVLLSVLGKVTSVIQPRSIPSITECVYLGVDGDRLKLEATNLESSVVSFCDAVVSESGSILLNPLPLLSFLAIGGESVSINSTLSECCVETDNNKLTMSLIKGDFPTAPQVEGISIVLIGLKQAIIKVEKAQASEDSRPVLAGIALIPQSNILDVVAVDGFRLVVAQIPLTNGAILPRMLLIPRRTVGLLGKLAGEQVLLTVNPDPKSRYASFESNEVTIVTELTQGTYPNYTALISQSSAYCLTINAATLTNILRACGEPINHTVKLQTAEEFLTIRTKNDDNHVEFKIPSHGQIKVAANHRYLLDLLEIMDGNIEIKTNEPNNPIMVQSGGLTYLLMPMWVEW